MPSSNVDRWRVLREGYFTNCAPLVSAVARDWMECAWTAVPGVNSH